MPCAMRRGSSNPNAILLKFSGYRNFGYFVISWDVVKIVACTLLS
jgi:hypothetical protein